MLAPCAISHPLTLALEFKLQLLRLGFSTRDSCTCLSRFFYRLIRTSALSCRGNPLFGQLLLKQRRMSLFCFCVCFCLCCRLLGTERFLVPHTLLLLSRGNFGLRFACRPQCSSCNFAIVVLRPLQGLTFKCAC